MAEPNNELIYNTLLKQNEQLGRIEANVDATAKAFDSHVKEDKDYYKRIERIENAHHRMRGAAAVWSLLVSGVVTAIGWYFSSHK